MFTIKQIRGAEVKKRKKRDCRCLPEEGCGCHIDTFNDGIDAQASVKLRFKREKLAEIWYETCRKYYEERHTYATGEELADAIIKAADDDPNSVLEVVKD